MKPDWKNAPEWARFLTQDEDGWWVWWSAEPVPDGYDSDGWFWVKAQNSDICRRAKKTAPNTDWDLTLEPRRNA